jgi:hypothetical protein
LRNRIIEAIIVAISGGVMTFLSSLIIAYFFNSNAVVRIGASTKVEENQFLLPIDIHTFKEDIKELRVDVPVAIAEKQIKSNQPIKVKVVLCQENRHVKQREIAELM